MESWLRNFKVNRVTIESEGEVSHRAMRIWDFYLRACIGTFHVIRGTYYGNAQYLLGPSA